MSLGYYIATNLILEFIFLIQMLQAKSIMEKYTLYMY